MLCLIHKLIDEITFLIPGLFHNLSFSSYYCFKFRSLFRADLVLNTLFLSFVLSGTVFYSSRYFTRFDNPSSPRTFRLSSRFFLTCFFLIILLFEFLSFSCKLGIKYFLFKLCSFFDGVPQFCT